MASEEHPSSTTIPSETIESQTPPSTLEPAKPSPSPKNSTLRNYILRYFASHASGLDRLLVRLSAILANPSATDALLSTISYTLQLLSALLTRFLAHRLTNIATAIAEKAEDVLLPGETVIATVPTSPSTKLASQVAKSSQALSGVIADYRIFVRMWGLAGLYMWAKGAWNAPPVAANNSKEKTLRAIAWAEIASLVAFQVLENGAYLSSKGVLTSAGWSGEAGKIREGKWWVWSCRFWVGYVALELLRVGVLYYDGKEQTTTVSQQEKELVADGEKEGKLLQQQKIQTENRLWWRDLVSNLAYFPMTLHWSTEKGILSDMTVGALGSIAGGSLFAEQWRQTA